MEYDTLVRKLARLSRQSPEAVRDVLFFMPDVLMDLEEGEHVRTPMGSFRASIREGRTYTAPDSDEGVERGPVVLIKMRAGLRMRRPL